VAIHPTAIVAPGAEIHPTCEIGPYAIVGPKVRMGPGNVVGGHAHVEGNTVLGAGNRIFGHAVVGAPPQDLKYRGEDTLLELGDGNVIREFASVHTGTVGGGGVTRLGNQCLVMASAHVAHDCILGDRNIIANGTQLGGHVTIESGVVVGALSGIHQFARLGESAIIGAGSMVSQDVPPFCNATGDRATLHGLNALGLKRRGLSAEAIRALRQAYRIMFQSHLRVVEAAARIRAEITGVPEVERFVAFIEASTRGVCREEGRRTKDEGRETDEE
jgi:UDP-N-acetylglucosamine acyltransferase